LSWLLLTQDFPPNFTGGVAAWADDLATALDAVGEDIQVLARAGRATDAFDESRTYAIHRIRGRSWGRLQGLWTGLGALPHIGRDTRIIAATWRLAAGVLPQVRATGATLLVACHGSDLTRLRSPPAGLLRVARATHHFLPVSRFLSQELDRLGVDTPRQVLPMALALPPPDQTRSRRGLVLVARLTPLKGLERTVRLAKGLGLPLTVIGDGPARTQLSTTSSVRFLGRLPRARALDHLASARAAVLLPQVDEDGTGAEGLGLCLLEAAARATPVIGCRVGGVPEAVGPGLVLDDADHPDLDQVARFLDDPEAGARARAWVSDHHGPAHTLAVLHEAAS